MATTNFYLKPEDKKGFSQVMLVYQDKGKKASNRRGRIFFNNYKELKKL